MSGNDARSETAGPLTEAELTALIGHRFPGGTITIAHWENFLLTDCTGFDQLPDGLVHPIALFHVPIQGVATSIAQLFALFRAEGFSGVQLLGYDWEYFEPLRENVAYRCQGGIVAAERSVSSGGRLGDTVAFSIELLDGDRPVARITNRWRFHRSAP
jgi:hypothetical protein